MSCNVCVRRSCLGGMWMMLNVDTLCSSRKPVIVFGREDALERTDTADAAVKVISSSHRVQQGYSTWLRCQTHRLLEKHSMKMNNVSGQSCTRSTQSYRWTRELTHSSEICGSAVLAVILSPLDIVPSDRTARIPEEPQWRHMGDIQGLGFRVEVGFNDVVLSKKELKSVGSGLGGLDIRVLASRRPRPGCQTEQCVHRWKCFCALIRNRTRNSRDEKEGREFQLSPLKLDRAEDDSAHTLFSLASSHTPVVTACTCAFVNSFKSNTNNASYLTFLLGVRSHVEQWALSEHI